MNQLQRLVNFLHNLRNIKMEKCANNINTLLS